MFPTILLALWYLRNLSEIVTETKCKGITQKDRKVACNEISTTCWHTSEDLEQYLKVNTQKIYKKNLCQLIFSKSSTGETVVQSTGKVKGKVCNCPLT